MEKNQNKQGLKKTFKELVGLEESKKKVDPQHAGVGCLLLIATAVVIYFASGDSSADASKTANVRQSATINKIDAVALSDQIKQDSLYHVKAVKVNGTVLCVAAPDLEKGSEGGDAKYFLTHYELEENKNISKCVVYKWKKRDSEQSVFDLEQPAGFNLPEWQIRETKEFWEKKNISAWDGSCAPLEAYLKNILNDADSYEHVETRYIYQVGENNFRVICSYRAKNAFGAKILQHVVAIVSTDGQVLSVKDLDE